MGKQTLRTNGHTDMTDRQADTQGRQTDLKQHSSSNVNLLKSQILWQNADQWLFIYNMSKDFNTSYHVTNPTNGLQTTRPHLASNLFPLSQMHPDEFILKFEHQYPNHKWADVEVGTCPTTVWRTYELNVIDPSVLARSGGPSVQAN